MHVGQPFFLFYTDLVPTVPHLKDSRHVSAKDKLETVQLRLAIYRHANVAKN